MNSHFSLSPSRIARFFFHECDRYLRYHATPKAERKVIGIPDIPFDTSPVTMAILESGYNWEENVIQNKLNGRVRIAKGKSRLCERTHSAEKSVTLLKNLEPDEAVYQPTFKAPRSFYSLYGLDTALCNFPPCRPDLVQLIKNNGKAFLRIIDIKAGTTLRTSHRIQAALYTLILKEILREQIPDMVLDDTAGIWLFGQEEPEWFDLRLSTGAIEQFLGKRLNGILTSPIDKVSWHLFFRCEWCEFYNPCREEAEKTKSVSLVPYLSVGGRRYLKQGIREQAGSVNSLDELKKFLENSSSDKLLDPCGSLRGKRNRLQNAVEALQKGKAIPHGSSSSALPASENICIVMTLQDDPVSGEIYTAGFRRVHGKDVYGDSARTEIFIAKTPEECAVVRHQFLRALFDELSLLDAYNNKRLHNWKEQKTLQVYVFDSFEITLFNQVLFKAAKDADMAPVAMQLLFYFQNPSLAGAEQHPGYEIPFPIIALTNIIRRLVALPLPISLRLPEVAGMLPSPNFAFEFEPNDLFWFNLSNTLKSDAIFQAWNLGNTDAVEWVHDEIKRRLTATHSVIEGLREKVRERLFAHPPRFFFPAPLDFENPELSRLAFIVRYESFMSAMKQREARTQSWPERVHEGKSIPLKLEHGNRWKVESEIDSTSLETGGFPNYILVPAGEKGDQAQMAYNDYAHCKSVYAPKNGEVRLAGITDLDSDEKTGLATHLCLEVKYGKFQKCFFTGDQAVLHPRFTDFNSNRMISRIRELDDLGASDFLALIKNPPEFASKIRIKKESKNSALKAAKKYAGFTKSQGRAFRQFMSNRLTLVWGPPGTGKTHFLAKAVLCMAEACKQENRQLRVAITAFTHAAIENLLEEIRENIPVFGLENSVSLFKLKQFSSLRGESIQVLSERALYKVMDEDILIVGGTVYSFQKADIEEEFPILIVDEASQMKFGELALGMMPLAKGGRMVLAGDDLQLPPIIQGEYPESEDGLPGLHNSVFAYLRARDNIGDDIKNPYTLQLQENWRMNKTLSFFPASTLYGEDYRPVNRKVKTQKLVFKQNKNRKKESEFCEWLADPDYSLAVCILEDIRAAKENQVEARMVAMLSVYLRKRLVKTGIKKTGTKIYPDSKKGDMEFWRKGLFIVSPHHAQIRSVKKELFLLRKWKSQPFVDTVDKMQGQQCQTVIVSYGVSDVETALAEADFIYSLNRLNVSVTRAQSKCIAFLPRPLLEPSFEALQSEKAVRGLGHMHALADFCCRFGEQRDFSLDNKSRITVMRV